MGNVLLRCCPPEQAAREGVPPDDTDLFVREVFQNLEWVQLDRGTLPLEDAIRSICARLPERLHPCVRSLLLGWWRHPLPGIPGMEDLLRELKGLDYDLYLLSNATSALHKYGPRLPGWDCFDGVLVSADHHMLKPHREIFELFFRTFGLHPGECLFIDDSPANIDGGKQAGMDGVLFLGDAGRLRRDLALRGIPVHQL